VLSLDTHMLIYSTRDSLVQYTTVVSYSLRALVLCGATLTQAVILLLLHCILAKHNRC
jgi:hypothetical protein